MKLSILKRADIVWLLAATVITFSPQYTAAAVVYTDGDLFVGFHATGGQGATQAYLINIGQASTYRDAAVGSSSTLSLGNIGIDLTAIYGSTWNTRADLFWGITGAIAVATAGDPANTLYATKAQTQVGTLESGWARRSNSAQTGTVSKIQGIASGYLNDQQGSTDTNSSLAIIENTSDPNNWASYQPGGFNSTAGSSLGVFTPTIEGSFAGGTAGSRLDLFRMVRTGIDDGTGSLTGLGTYEATFSIADNGAIGYLVVPEPSTAAMTGLGIALLGLNRRRRQKQTAMFNR